MKGAGWQGRCDSSSSTNIFSHYGRTDEYLLQWAFTSNACVQSQTTCSYQTATVQWDFLMTSRRWQNTGNSAPIPGQGQEGGSRCSLWLWHKRGAWSREHWGTLFPFYHSALALQEELPLRVTPSRKQVHIFWILSRRASILRKNVWKRRASPLPLLPVLILPEAQARVGHSFSFCFELPFHFVDEVEHRDKLQGTGISV